TEEGDNYPKLREALEELSLNDASLIYEPIRGQTILGRGFRLGFLGMLHLEIVKERLIREHKVDVFITPPAVNLRIEQNKKMADLKDLFDYDNQGRIEEPFVELELITPAQYMGMVMGSLSRRRAKQKDTQFLSENLSILIYEIPLSEIIIDFYDELKSISKGFASMSYTFIDYYESELVRLDVLIAGEMVAPFSRIIPKERMEIEAKKMALRLKKLIPKQNFQVSIQVCFGGRVLAREDISAFRKDVIAKLYGGDRTRKDKLLKKQAKGKKRMKRFGRVDIPSDVFLKMLKK
ncbi:elongation factor 4, partial [Patescibacteria group bacterium]|nr:elongation factor 4 [Patescibacteria group bacterium]